MRSFAFKATVFSIVLSGIVLVIAAQSITKLQQQFVLKVAGSARNADQAILADRARLQRYYQAWQANHEIHFWERQWLDSLAAHYGITQPNFKNDATWKKLLNRVDIIPVSLVIAQAATESDWGRSRFANEGNNYFGQHCMRLGCGLVPKNRNPGETFEVERFANLLGSIRAYMLMLNKYGAYRKLRVLRAQLRAENKTVSGMVLANGLKRFSQHPRYIQIIQTVISKFQFDKYDDPLFLLSKQT